MYPAGSKQMDIDTFILSSEDGLMIKEIIYGRLKLSRGLARRMHGGGAYLNGIRTYITQRVKVGDRLQILFDDEPTEVKPQNLDLDVLYEDDCLLVLNKYPGLAVYPTATYPKNTLANGVAYLWQLRGIKRKVRLLHRLDRETSGVIMVIKDPYSYQIMVRQLRTNQLQRYYLAIVKGIMPSREGIINEPIGRTTSSEGHALKREVSKEGKPAKTHYQVVKEYKDFSLVQLRLLTGRTHQIRVHLSWLGCPIVGDEMYFQSNKLIHRQALHAWCIRFKHPKTERILTIRAPLPRDMVAILRHQLH